MVRVFVWNYGGFWKSLVGSTYNVGHAAVGIDTNTANKSIYLSWWPSGEDRKRGTIGNNSLADPHLDVLQDLREEGTKKRKRRKKDGPPLQRTQSHRWVSEKIPGHSKQ